MKAIILAAGYATRLYPLTINKPKALLPISGKPILNYIVEKIEKVKEIDEIFIVTNDKFYMNFVYWLAQNEKEFGKKIEILNDGTTSNEARLGGIGDLYFVIKEKNIEDDILVLACDNLFEDSLVDLIDFFKKKQAIINAVFELENKEEVRKFGVIEIDKEGKIIEFEEKPQEPKTNLISRAIYIFPKESLKNMGEYMKTEKPKDAPGFLIKDFCKKQEVYAFIFKGKWFDIGSKETYEKVKDSWEK